MPDCRELGGRHAGGARLAAAQPQEVLLLFEWQLLEMDRVGSGPMAPPK